MKNGSNCPIWRPFQKKSSTVSHAAFPSRLGICLGRCIKPVASAVKEGRRDRFYKFNLRGEQDCFVFLKRATGGCVSVNPFTRCQLWEDFQNFVT